MHHYHENSCTDMFDLCLNRITSYNVCYTKLLRCLTILIMVISLFACSNPTVSNDTNSLKSSLTQNTSTETRATTYYIDTQAEFDAISSTTYSAGDEILLKRGSTFSGSIV